MPRPPSDTKTISALLQIVADLRGPEGCPWDLEQTHQSLAPFTLEESMELVEILDQLPAKKPSITPLDLKLKDELGDLLFQVVLHSQLAAERHSFDFQDVVQNLNEKLIRRHPHVFADEKVNDVNDVWSNWEKIKASEKQLAGASGNPFDFPKNLPALQRSHKIGVKTQKRGFDWPDAAAVEIKFHEEWAEFKEALQSQNKTEIIDEMGDVLFTLAQLSRHLDFDSEQALRLANQKFEARYCKMMELCENRGIDWSRAPDADKEALWSEAKTWLRSQTQGSAD